MAEVVLKNIKKSFGDVDVIKGVDLHIEDKEFCIFVGPSGCGKSTLLRMIAGLEEITSGDLHIAGTQVNNLSPADRGISMVFQSYALYPHMTVRDNMGFSLKLAKQSPDEIKRKVDDAARILKLEPLLDRKPAALSGGQRQRVAIGRAIVRNPKVFLFDEPLSNLDAALRVATRIEIAQLKESMPESTMVYVTHDQVEAMTLATRIVVLANRGIAQVGSPLDLYERPENEFVAQFIGSPAMNLLPGEIVQSGDVTHVKIHDGGGIIQANIPTRENRMGASVKVGIRPEDMALTSEENYAFEGKVEIAEALGEVTQVYFGMPNPGDSPVIAKLPGIHRDVRNQSMRMTADPSKIHLFADGSSLYYD